MAMDFPDKPAIGATWPNPPVDNQPTYVWDGQKWTSGSGFGAVYISDTVPAAPVGSLWWESDTGFTFIRFYDGDSTQWVQTNGSVMDNSSIVGAGSSDDPHSVGTIDCGSF